MKQADVLHAKPGNPHATLVGDLSTGRGIPNESFDCVVLTQTLPFIYDLQGTIRTLRRILKPGGVLLATVPGISQIARYDMDEWGDFWRFTSLSTRRLFEDVFGPEHTVVRSHGNVMAATALLHGLVSSELTAPELDFLDRDYEVVITVRAVKSH